MADTPSRDARAALAAERRSMSFQLREAIKASGLSAYAIAAEADTDVTAVTAFMRGERDIRLGTASRIANVVGVRLAPDGRRRPAR